MKKLEAYQTKDGVIHKSLDDATRYAENRFGNAALALAKKLVQTEKYTKMVDFLTDPDTLLQLQELIDLKADTFVNPED